MAEGRFVTARRLDELRRNWLDPEGASEADLKKRTLTNLYNDRPTWLENAHAPEPCEGRRYPCGQPGFGRSGTEDHRAGLV